MSRTLLALALVTLAPPAFAGPTCPDADADGVCDADDVCPTRPDLADAIVTGMGVVGTVDACTTPDPYPGGSCLYSNASDATFTWTAGETGLFRFSDPSSAATALLAGPESDCGLESTRLACHPFSNTGSVTVGVQTGDALRLVFNMEDCTDGVTSLLVERCTDADGDDVPDGACAACVGDTTTLDVDGDQLCGDLDPCTGVDNVDADLDGVCDSLDQCWGIDSSGDGDGDGFCDSDDVCPTLPDLADATVTGIGVVGTVDACTTPDPYPGGPCLYSNASDATFTWTAGETGLYRFSDPRIVSTALLVGPESDCGLESSALECHGWNTRGDVTVGVQAGDALRLVFNVGDCASGPAELLVERCTDADGDGVPDGACAACIGDTTTRDDDGDQLCGDLDPCTGPDNVDGDGDGVCDSLDQCSGDDLTGDTDGDGVCDDLDLCTGDDASGDADADGTCLTDVTGGALDCDDGNPELTLDANGDGRCDPVLSVSDIVAGQPMTLRVLGAAPLSTVSFIVSPQGLGTPTCHPRIPGICSPLTGLLVIGSASADGAGAAELTITVPSQATTGTELWFHAGWIQRGDGEMSNVVETQAL